MFTQNVIQETLLGAFVKKRITKKEERKKERKEERKEGRKKHNVGYVTCYDECNNCTTLRLSLLNQGFHSNFLFFFENKVE